MPQLLASARVLALALSVAACGGPPPPQPVEHGPRIGMHSTGDEAADESSQRVAAVEGSVELTLRRGDGTFIDIGEMRGSVVVLFIFATFDGVSQMVLRPLTQLAERLPEVRIVAIAAQPSARLLIDAYEHALSPPFPVAYDPEETVQSGTSPLGPIESVPTLVVLDRRGVEVARHTGFADAARVDELVAAAQ